MKILLIDDDATTNFIHQTKLNKLIKQAELSCVSNGQEALSFCRKNKAINLAFLDLNMPVMDGLTFLKAHKKLPKDHQIKKIVLFTDKEIDDSLKTSLNISFCIPKPLNEEKINTILNDQQGVS